MPVRWSRLWNALDTEFLKRFLFPTPPSACVVLGSISLGISKHVEDDVALAIVLLVINSVVSGIQSSPLHLERGEKWRQGGRIRRCWSELISLLFLLLYTFWSAICPILKTHQTQQKWKSASEFWVTAEHSCQTISHGANSSSWICHIDSMILLFVFVLSRSRCKWCLDSTFNNTLSFITFEDWTERARYLKIIRQQYPILVAAMVSVLSSAINKPTFWVRFRLGQGVESLCLQFLCMTQFIDIW